MKLKLFSGLTLSALVLLSGCASYRATALNQLSSEVFVAQSVKKGDVTMVAKAFDKADCKKYLDRDVLKEGYQPVQLYIQNDSDKSYYFSLNRVGLPVAQPELVAEKVHTSTMGRALGYGIPGVLLLWPLVIPAVVDGVKSSEANSLLDSDFASKAAKDQMILPHSHFNKILFVPVSEYESSFNVTILDPISNEAKDFSVAVQS